MALIFVLSKMEETREKKIGKLYETEILVRTLNPKFKIHSVRRLPKFIFIDSVGQQMPACGSEIVKIVTY